MATVQAIQISNGDLRRIATSDDMQLGGFSLGTTSASDTFEIGGTTSSTHSSSGTFTFTAGSMQFNDNINLTFGTGADANVHWDATNLRIENSGATASTVVQLGSNTVDTSFVIERLDGANLLEVTADGHIDADYGTITVPSGTDFQIAGTALTTNNFTAANLDEILSGGTAGQVLTAAGAGGAPTFQDPATVTTGTTSNTWTINSDSAAGTEEDACLILKSADAAGETNSVFTGELCLAAGNIGEPEFELTADDDGTTIAAKLNLGAIGTAENVDPHLAFRGSNTSAHILFDSSEGDLDFQLGGLSAFKIVDRAEMVIPDNNTKLAINDGALATGDGSVSLGFGNSAGGTNAVSVGRNAQAPAINSIAIGFGAQPQAARNIAIGSGANAAAGVGDNVVIIGYEGWCGNGVSDAFCVGGTGSAANAITKAFWGQGSDGPYEGSFVHYASDGRSVGTNPEPRGYHHTFQGGTGAAGNTTNKGGVGGQSTLQGGTGGSSGGTQYGGDGGDVFVTGGSGGANGTITTGGSSGGSAYVSGGTSVGVNAIAPDTFIRSGLGTGNATGGGRIRFQVVDPTTSGSTTQTYRTTGMFSTTRGQLILGGGQNSQDVGGYSAGILQGVTGSAGDPGGDLLLRGGAVTSGSNGGYVAIQTGNTTFTERLRIENDGEWQIEGDAGTAGQVLTSQGPGTTPTWTTPTTAPASTATTGWTESEVFTNNTAAYITADDSVGMADASNGAGKDEFIGIRTAAGEVTHTGQVAAAIFVAGLTLSAGDRVWVSKTAGRFTNDVSGFTTGDWVIPVGRVRDASTYSGSADDPAEIILAPGEPTIL